MRLRLTSRSFPVALAVAITLLLTGCLSTGQDAVLREMNADRTANGRSSLPIHDALQTKAQVWAEKIADDGALSHSNLRSGLPSCWQSAGENVGVGPSVASVEDAYMRSASHRANILNTTWDFVGVGMAQRGDRVFTVQVFMRGCR